MGNVRTSEEVQNDLIKAMGKDLGEMMYFFQTELYTLFMLLSDIKILYSGKKCNVDLLNASAPRFFWAYQRMWWQYMTIGIVRIIEPKEKRASLYHLIDLVSDERLKSDLQSEYDELKILTKSILRARHNLFAHYNLHQKITNRSSTIDGLTIASIRESLNKIGEIYNLIYSFYTNANTPWDWIEDDLGARQILSSLAMGETFEPLYFKYKKDESITDEDFNWHKFLEEK